MQNSIGGRVRILTEDRILGGQIDSSTLTPSRPLFFCNPIFSLLIFSGTNEGMQHGRSCESDGKEGFWLIPPLLSCHERGSGGQIHCLRNWNASLSPALSEQRDLGPVTLLP